MPPDRKGQASDLDTRYQRYFSSLGTGASPRAIQATSALRRLRRQAVVAVLGALLLGVFLGVAFRGTQAGARPTTRVVTQTKPTPACVRAVDRANRSLAYAVQVEKALAEHTQYMNELFDGKISSSRALKEGMPSLITGASASARFDAALADYRQVVKACRLPAS
ncbi:MAG TPA: hypothetical protein VG276_30165 [Actinomycetes bacterium]|jgi:hypothetical protein|nr:hypothetical protein [Actinomycetes bacterium]